MAGASNQPTNCAHVAKNDMHCLFYCDECINCLCMCHGFHLSVWASNMVAKPSVHQTCGCGWPGRPRTGSGLPDERLEYASASEAFLVRGGQLECLVCQMVGKGIWWLDFVRLSATLGLAQIIIIPWMETGHTNVADFGRTCLARAYLPRSRPFHSDWSICCAIICQCYVGRH